jgi:glycosyltransferase involved in cell wall biosynthesis
MSQKTSKIKPLISVIIPVYNIEKYISKCLDSVLNQTLDRDKYEVIIIDDGSTDKSLEICKQKTKGFDNAKIIEHKKNKGLGPARNTGIKEAKGEYLYFIDGDDYIDNNTLENLLELAQEYKADIVTSGFKRVDEKGHILFKKNDYTSLTDDKFENLKMFLASQVTHTAWGKLIKRSLFLDNNIEYPKGIHEDIPVTYLLFWYADKIHVSDEISYYWVKRNSSITSYISKEHIDGWFNAIDKQKEFIELNFPKNSDIEELHKSLLIGLTKAFSILLESLLNFIEDPNEANVMKEYLYQIFLERIFND